MSMTLILWKAPVTDDPDEAERLLKPWYETEDDSAFEPSPDIAKVADELRRLYPYWPISGEEVMAAMSEEERGRYTEEGLAELREAGSVTQDEDGPWADLPFYESDRLLALDIRWSADNAVIDDIFRFAREHGLVLYDPQGPDVALPSDPVDTGRPRLRPFGTGSKSWRWPRSCAASLTPPGKSRSAGCAGRR